jgi:hypothetical protein
VKVLWLTNSDDLGQASPVPEEQRSYRLAARRFEERTGEPAEMIPRVIWPSPKLPGLIDEWIERYEPDMVMFRINGYWYLYHSVPLQIERALGRVGRPVARAGTKISKTPWIAHTLAYHYARKGATRVFGGATYFHPDEITELVDVCVRRILQHEQLMLVVRDQLGDWDDVDRWYYVHRKVSALCESLHVKYVGRNPFGPEQQPGNLYDKGDRFHTNALGQAWYAEKESEAMAEVWLATRGAAI